MTGGLESISDRLSNRPNDDTPWRRRRPARRLRLANSISKSHDRLARQGNREMLRKKRRHLIAVYSCSVYAWTQLTPSKLADPTRRSIVEALGMAKGRSTTSLQAGIHQSGVSRHLRISTKQASIRCGRMDSGVFIVSGRSLSANLISGSRSTAICGKHALTAWERRSRSNSKWKTLKQGARHMNDK